MPLRPSVLGSVPGEMYRNVDPDKERSSRPDGAGKTAVRRCCVQDDGDTILRVQFERRQTVGQIVRWRRATGKPHDDDDRAFQSARAVQGAGGLSRARTAATHVPIPPNRRQKQEEGEASPVGQGGVRRNERRFETLSDVGGWLNVRVRRRMGPWRMGTLGRCWRGAAYAASRSREIEGKQGASEVSTRLRPTPLRSIDRCHSSELDHAATPLTMAPRASQRERKYRSLEQGELQRHPRIQLSLRPTLFPRQGSADASHKAGTRMYRYLPRPFSRARCGKRSGDGETPQVRRWRARHLGSVLLLGFSFSLFATFLCRRRHRTSISSSEGLISSRVA